MQKRRLYSAFLATAIPCHQPALADTSLEARLEPAESQTQSLENRRLQPDDLGDAAPQAGVWSERIGIDGLIEVEAALQETETGDKESSLDLARVEIGILARISRAITGELVLCYEDDGARKLAVDVAAISLAPVESWFVNAGQFYLPFGRFDTGMISDPLTLEIAEIRETAVEAGFAAGILSGSLYLFDGDASDQGGDRIDNYGITLGLSNETGGDRLAASLGYINDLGDSDSLIDFAGEVHEPVGGVAFSALLGLGPFTLIGEYVGATRAFDSGERPSARNLEAGYGFSLYGREMNLAIGFQGTEDAEAIDLPQRLAISALTVELSDGTRIGIELSAASSYAGDRSHSLLLQLATRFQ